MMFRILAILLIPAAALASDITEDILKSDSNLSKVKDMIRQEQQTIRELQDEKKRSAKRLKKAQIELDYHNKITRRLSKKLTASKQELAAISFRQTVLQNRQDELIKIIKEANFYLAGAGETELLEALIMADEHAELSAGFQIISRVNSNLFDIVEEIDKNSKELKLNSGRLLEKQQELEKTLLARKKSKKNYEDKKTLVSQLYKIASEDEKIKTEYIKLLESKERELENKIKALETARLKNKELSKFSGLKTTFNKMKKKLIPPVNGKIIEKFGRKKVKGFKGYVHKKGIKIKPNESQAASVYDGVVMHTDTAWGLGWFVIVEHYGGYYTLYANLDDIKVRNGQKVHTGEVLGTIDVDRDSNTPYLYFEIRIHDKAVDPMRWLLL